MEIIKTDNIIDKLRKEDIMHDLNIAHKMSTDYINEVNNMRVYPSQENIDNLKVFDEKLSELPQSTEDILSQLNTYGSPSTVAQTGGRYFGFVCGGILPSSLSAKWLVDAWDQNPGVYVLSPIVSKIEEVTEKWIVDLLGLSKDTVVGFVGGSSSATMIGLTTGRNTLLENLGYDFAKKGLLNAPKIKVVIGEKAHSSVYKALSIIGFGSDSIIKVPADNQGRINPEKMPILDKNTLVVLQAGNVDTGAFDDFNTICKNAKKAGAWVHVDGAFGLWAAANSNFEHLTNGMELADSWSADAHKTLNAPYDSGLILCRHKQKLINSMHMTGSYIQLSENRDGMFYTSDMSRRARAVELWAGLKSLGSIGVSQLVWELHQNAQYFSKLLKQGGLKILNDVVFNQVLVCCESDSKTIQLIKGIQESGVCWMGGSKWNNKAVMRISVSSYKTTKKDVEISASEILKIYKSL